MKFEFIAKNRGIWPVTWLCGVLNVSPSEFYSWRSRPLSDRALYDEELIRDIRRSFSDSGDTYGVRHNWPDLHHSDQGSQYTCEQFQKLLADHGIECSMSRLGECHDNAVMESFFSRMKDDRVSRRRYRTRDEARADIFDYIERFYNPKRRRSTLGGLSPIEYEKRAKLA